MPDSGQCASTENVAATEPPGAEQATANHDRGVLCILCSGPAPVPVVISVFESVSGSGTLLGCGYCASLLGARKVAA